MNISRFSFLVCLAVATLWDPVAAATTTASVSRPGTTTSDTSTVTGSVQRPGTTASDTSTDTATATGSVQRPGVPAATDAPTTEAPTTDAPTTSPPTTTDAPTTAAPKANAVDSITPSCQEVATESIVTEWTGGSMDRDDTITMQRAAKTFMDHCPRWEISYGNVRFYSIQDNHLSCANKPPTQSTWNYNSYSSADGTSFPAATITEGPCPGGSALECKPLDIVPDLAYDVPENPCPRVWCVSTADPRVSGEFWEDIRDKQETSGDFLRDGVPRYIRARPSYQAFQQCPNVASASGDPHFLTWKGHKYDFHGGCPLILLENPHFASGLGMNIHIKTSIRSWWSFIEVAVIQIGDNTLEIIGGNGGSSFWINGGEKKTLVTGDAFLGDYSVHFRRVNNHQSITRVNLGHGDAISIETWKDFVRLNVRNRGDKAFLGSAGLLGSYPTGEMIARDGVTLIEDSNEFGQEWMVRPTDAMLFHDTDPSMLPLKCPMPDEAMKEENIRRLGESTITEEDAELACSHINLVDRDACISDVLATNDKDIAGSYYKA